MDAKTGEQKWISQQNLNVFGSGAAVGDAVYFGSFNGKMYAIDSATGKVNCYYQTDSSKLNYSKVIDSNDKFKEDLLNRYWNGEGKEVFDLITTLGFILSSPAVDNGVVYFGSTDGYLDAIE